MHISSNLQFLVLPRQTRKAGARRNFACFNSGSALRFAPQHQQVRRQRGQARGGHIQHSIQYQSPQAGRGVALGFQAVIQIIYRFCFAGCGIQAVFQPFARAA